MIFPSYASSKFERPVQRTASVCALAGAAPPVDTSFGAKHAASRGAAAKAASLSTASLRSERGSKNGRDRAVVEMQIAAVAIISVTCFIPVLPHAAMNHFTF